VPTKKQERFKREEWMKIGRVTTITNKTFLAESEYIYDITTTSNTFVLNNLWVHNCVSITMYPFLFGGLKNIGGISEAPTNLDSFCGSFINLVFAVAAQFAGAVSTPEWATQTIPAEYPPVAEFKARADELIKERYGITVEHITLSKLYGISKDKISYEDLFYYVLPAGKYVGQIKGFPLQRGPWCNHLKTAATRERERERETVRPSFVIWASLPMSLYGLHGK